MNVPILMYHEIIDENPSPRLLEKVQTRYLVPLERFRQQMAWLRESGYTAISLRELMDALETGKQAAQRPVVITFDDGYAGNYHHALPVLKELGQTATFFITTGRMGMPEMLSWEQAREMNENGMSIQSHTVSHAMLSTLSPGEMEFELSESRRAIEEAVKEPVEFISYPNGDHHPALPGLLRKTGYSAACSSRFGLNDARADRFNLKRIVVTGSHAGEDLKGILNNNGMRHIGLSVKDALLSSARKIMGPENYETVYMKLFRLKPWGKA